MMNNTIAAVVVTYNRKVELIECLIAIRQQTKEPDLILIVDNLSNDGTPELLLKEKYIEQLPANDMPYNQLLESSVHSLNGTNKEIKISYIRKWKNDGGAGGFYEGMKRAYDLGFEWLWLMDDDGLPEKTQLALLVANSQKYDLHYSNALVVNKANSSELAFGLGNYSKVSEINEEIIFDRLNPFNGTFIHRKVPKRIGFIKKEMFIWGDEVEYTLRVKSHKFRTGTITCAIHFHPKSKTEFQYVIPFLKLLSVELKPKNRMEIFFRNKGFIQKAYGSQKGAMFIVLKYMCFYLFRLRFSEMIISYKAFKEGMKNNF